MFRLICQGIPGVEEAATEIQLRALGLSGVTYSAPMYAYPAATVNDLLRRYTGLTVEQTSGMGTLTAPEYAYSFYAREGEFDRYTLEYVEELDAYFYSITDYDKDLRHVPDITFDTAQREDGVVHLYYTVPSGDRHVQGLRFCVTLRQAQEGWQFVSHQRVEQANQRDWSWGDMLYDRAALAKDSWLDGEASYPVMSEIWAEDLGFSCGFSPEDREAAQAVVQAELDRRAGQPETAAFRVTSAPKYYDRATLSAWKRYFCSESTAFPDWTAERMQSDFMAVSAVYEWERNDGRQDGRFGEIFYLVRSGTGWELWDSAVTSYYEDMLRINLPQAVRTAAEATLLEQSEVSRGPRRLKGCDGPESGTLLGMELEVWTPVYQVQQPNGEWADLEPDEFTRLVFRREGDGSLTYLLRLQDDYSSFVFHWREADIFLRMVELGLLDMREMSAPELLEVLTDHWMGYMVLSALCSLTICVEIRNKTRRISMKSELYA